MTCVWEPEGSVLSEDFNALDPEQQENALTLATASLQVLTYNRVGACPITIRPCPEPDLLHRCDGLFDLLPARDQRPYGGFAPYIGTDGQWYNACAGCGDVRVCKPLSEIDIPGPVGYIDQFLIGGQAQVLDGGNWRLDDGHLLVWQGTGPSPVPASQDLNLPDTAPGTWSITYSRSYQVGLTGRIAVAYLAMEFAKAFIPKAKCALPRGITSVVRSGVSFTVSAGLFPNGLTGIDNADVFILQWAPAGSPTQNAQVLDPVKMAPRRTNAVPMRYPAGSI